MCYKESETPKIYPTQTAEGSRLLPKFMYIVLLETSGNQRYIFSTNKLRENVGASELTYQIGTRIVVEQVRPNYKYFEDTDGSLLRKLLLDEKPLDLTDKNAVEIIIATSGKAMLLTNTKEKAEEIDRKVTKKALTDMPGLTVHGAICKVENKLDKSEADNLNETIGKVHRRLDEIRYQIPSNLQRFQRLPFVAECASSNLPAESVYVHESVKTREEKKPHSIASITKQEKSKDGKNRLENEVKKYESDLHFADNPNDLDSRFEDTKWFAVIHADGNGLGQIFLDFQEKIKANDRDEYREKYRNFSAGLDECTIKATAFALKNLQIAYRANRKNKNKDSIEIPAIPLVLGGDDLTIICDGQYAISFTKDFLTKFVEETKKPKIQDIFPNGVDLGICAGIAIIKPHYPFHQAYHLAEQLLQSAKKSKDVSPSISALDYHVLYDSSGVDLDEIRRKFKDFQVARPYIVSDETDLGELADNDWVKHRKFSELQTRVETMLKEEDGKRKIPNTQLHTLRERLHLGTNEAKAFASTIKHRYPTFEKLEPLFFLNEKSEEFTHFLDAMEIVEFWKGLEEKK